MKHLFIVTYGRSGATALMKVLNDIDGICIRGENGGVFRPIANAARMATETRRRYLDQPPGPDQPWYGADGIRADAFARDLAAAFERNVLCPPEGTRITGFKEVRYTDDDVTDAQFRAMLRLMLEAFEDSRVVFVTRAPEEAAESGWWRDRDRDVVIDILELTAERFHAAHAKFPERSFILDHSEFDRSPEGLRPFLDWLGVEVSAEQLAASLAVRLESTD